MNKTAPECVFCTIVAGTSPAVVIREWPDVIAIRPRHPVTPGHVLVIPRRHVIDVGADPETSARVMAAAAELAAELPAANVITSKGAAATQTQYHLHLHVVPRADGDGLPLPWTPQHAASRGEQVDNTARLRVVMAREPLPSNGPSVFLAGPTPEAGGGVDSWRPEAIRELAEQWAGPEPLTVLTPESRGGARAARYEDQVEWETAARGIADVVLYWIPRDVQHLPGFTTNVEFGLDVTSGRVVLGCPPDCPSPERNRYLIFVARRHGVTVCDGLLATVTATLNLLAVRARVGAR